jgi:hypothetical protein
MKRRTKGDLNGSGGEANNEASRHSQRNGVHMKTTLRVFAVAVIAVLLLAGCSKITKENYDQVATGMTQDQVIQILGSPDDKSEMEMPGLGLGKTETWGWHTGSSERQILIQFQNGRVALKNWFGAD